MYTHLLRPSIKVYISLSCFVCFSCVQGSFPRHWQGHRAPLLVLAGHPCPGPNALAPSCQLLSEQTPKAAGLGWGNPSLPWCAGHTCGSQREQTQQIPEGSGHGLCVRARSGFLHWPLSPSGDRERTLNVPGNYKGSSYSPGWGVGHQNMSKQLKSSFLIQSGFLGGKEQYAHSSMAVMVLFQETIYPIARRRSDGS